MENILVTIIVPVYNVEKYLKRCLDSILAQTYQNLEIILIDDGSTDNSGNICDDYLKIDKRIISLHKKNGGLSDARNYGILYSKGEYISFIDSDDFVHPDFIKILITSALETKSNIACVGFQLVEEDAVFKEKVNIDKNIKILTKKDAINELFKQNSYCDYAWNKIYKRELFDSIKYPYGRKMEDMGTTYKLFLKCNQICYCQSKLYYYVQRSNSIVHNCDLKFYKDKFEMCLERFENLRKIFPDLIDNYLCLYNVISNDCVYFEKEDRKLTLDLLKKYGTYIKKLKFKQRFKLFLYKNMIVIYRRIKHAHK